LTPAKGKQKKGFGALNSGVVTVNGGDHTRKSSVPVGSWRNSREIPVLQKEKDDVQPQVRVVEASCAFYSLLIVNMPNYVRPSIAEVDPSALPEMTMKKWDIEKGKLSVEHIWMKDEGRPGSGGEMQRLGSPFRPPGEREKLDG
jgi:hypothetical protein